MTVHPTRRLSTEPDANAPTRVLLADDSMAFRKLTSYGLSVHPEIVVVADVPDGQQALDRAAELHPDCVLLDLEMPRMGGFEALAEFQRRSPELPVILLSGRADAAIAGQAMTRGAAAFIVKTNQFTELAGIVRRVATRQPKEPSAPAPDVPRAAPSRCVAGPSSAPSSMAEIRRLEYVASHDLGEPLRIMAGFAGLLQSRYGDALDATGQSYVQHIVEAADRMQTMLTDLLGYSRAGQLQPHPELVELGPLVAQVVSAMEGTISARAAVVRVAPLPVGYGDPALLTTVLNHLLHNALLFNASSEPTVQVAGRLAGDTLVVTVTDNGIGIDPEQSERVFDLFQRLNTRQDYPGTGTGLALCRRLMSLQGGMLDLVTSPEPGSTLRLTLPAGPPDRPPTATHIGDA